MVDELPLLVQRRAPRGPAARSKARAAAVPAAASAARCGGGGGARELAARWDSLVQRVLDEAQSLVRVTRIDQPEAMLVGARSRRTSCARTSSCGLLNARLALLSRQLRHRAV